MTEEGDVGALARGGLEVPVSVGSVVGVWVEVAVCVGNAVGVSVGIGDAVKVGDTVTVDVGVFVAAWVGVTLGAKIGLAARLGSIWAWARGSLPTPDASQPKLCNVTKAKSATMNAYFKIRPGRVCTGRILA